MEIRVRSTGAVMYESEWKAYMKETTGKNFGRLDEATLDTYGSDIVYEGPQATGGTVYQYSQRDGVQEIDGKWYTKYILGPVFTSATAEAEYKALRDAEQATNVRRERDAKLAETDWTQLPDAPVGSVSWADYRQALRDVPTQDGFPWTVIWPEQP